MLVEQEKNQIMGANAIAACERYMLQAPQAECPVQHHFGPGIYIRAVTLPAGIYAIGHAQKFEHMNVMLTGKVAMVRPDGQLRLLEAPMVFVAPPGRKVGYVIEECTWLNVYNTTERDIDKLEEMFLEKSDSWELQNAEKFSADVGAKYDDRKDFCSMLSEYGFTAEDVRSQSERIEDQIPMPNGYERVSVRRSAIEGFGLFATSPIAAEEIIAPARIDYMRTPAGRYTNHAKTPNAKFVKYANGDIYLVAIRDIKGCKGGDQGEEVTVDYRQALSLSEIGPIKRSVLQ